MLLSPLAFAARLGGALITFAPVMLDVSNKGKECASAHGLHGCVVPTIPFAGHADHRSEVLQLTLISSARILAASITVMDESGLGAATSYHNGKLMLVLFDKLIFHLLSREKMLTTFLGCHAPVEPSLVLF